MIKAKTIAIAEDDEAILSSVSMALQDAGYTVNCYTDGRELCNINSSETRLVLLDIWMSGQDGRDICRSLKHDPTTCDIPVIMFSANRDGMQLALESGADHFLPKPFDLDELIRLIEKFTQDK